MNGNIWGSATFFTTWPATRREIEVLVEGKPREDFTLWHSGERPGTSLVFFEELTEAEVRSVVIRPKPRTRPVPPVSVTRRLTRRKK